MYMFVCLLSFYVCLYVRMVIINMLSLSLTYNKHVASTNDNDNNNSDDDDDDDIFNNRS